MHPARIGENFDIFDFTLMPADIAAIDALDQNKRGGPIRTVAKSAQDKG